jgi:hypothetical protein
VEVALDAVNLFRDRPAGTLRLNVQNCGQSMRKVMHERDPNIVTSSLSRST